MLGDARRLTSLVLDRRLCRQQADTLGDLVDAEVEEVSGGSIVSLVFLFRPV
jgi:hypothetical protein